MVTHQSETISGTKVASVQLELDNITLESGRLFEVKTPDGSLTDYGIETLSDYLYGRTFPKLPDDFEYVWLAKRGTLPKRVQSYYFKTHNIKLSPDHVSEIGNIAKAHSSNGQSYILDFTNRIDWRAGDFGDGGSCYWSCNSGAKDMLMDNGAWAVRAWKFVDNRAVCEPKTPYPHELNNRDLFRGYARAWLVPIGRNRFILFNAYGVDALTFSRLLALYWSCSYRKITLMNNGSDGGTLYINGCNYVIGKHSEIEGITHHDFGWEEPEKSDYCDGCSDELDRENDGYYCEQEDITVCGDCVRTCANCGENFYRSRYCSERDEFGDEMLCNYCYEARLETQREESEVR